ncbi:MAG: HupE/UreJ family protein [Phycisphaerales bacterium]|nr:MAG: HupE/UreJ family protein [Phycisphaerales bacterium]
MKRWWPGVLLTGFVIAPHAAAHEVRPAYLELQQTRADSFDVLWKTPARGDLRLGLYVRLPEECVVLSEPRGVFRGGAYIERWSVRHPQALVGTTIYIDGLESTLTDVLVRIHRLDGSTQVARFMPERPAVVVAGAPKRWQAAGTYLAVGVRHILGGVDHLLFVLGLLFLVQGRWVLVKTITAFTIAHSITLAIATLGYAEAPVKVLNVLIAMSILFLGPEIVRLHRGETSLTIRQPWVVAFAFGLLHGFGFAGGLTELGLPQSEIPLALLMFNIGVELGQLSFVAVLLGLAASFRVLEFRWQRWVRLVPAYVVGTLGAFWATAQLAAMFGR